MTGTNHTTSFFYADSYTILSGGQNVSYTPAGNTNAFLTKITDPLGHTNNFSYDFNNSQLTIGKDENGLSTTYLYNDSLARLTQTNFPDGGQTTISYNDAGPSPSLTTTKKINSSQSVTSVTVKDGLSHVKQTQLTSDPQGTVYVDITFDGLGRVWKQSNPYRSGNDPTTSSGITTLVYDALGRKTSETEPDGSVITTAYCGPNTLVTDPTARWRRSRVDGLGRLVEVDEPNTIGATVNSNGCLGTGEPIWVTSYTLDGLNNLTQVVQNGSHQRNFSYDSLSRLLTSNNPEVGTITYSYDVNGNVAAKTDARNITTTDAYDALNRLTSKTYSDGTVGSGYVFDTANPRGIPLSNTVGRLSMVYTYNSARVTQTVTEFSYDAMGRPVSSWQCAPVNCASGTWHATYTYDFAGNITSIIYPSGRVVNYTYDAADRPKTTVDGSNGITYATGFQTVPSGCLAGAVCYTPQATFYALSIGQSASFTGLNLTHTYSNRLQPNEFKATSSAGNAIDIIYNFVDSLSGKNAGHVYGTTDVLDSTRSQTFLYDQLNRITTAQTTSTYASSPLHCWGEAYGLDPWGNLQSIAATTNSQYTGCSQESGFSRPADTNNHLNGFSYDLSGNTQNDGSFSYTWDAESQLTSAGGVTYTYDAQGHRVQKSTGKNYIYGLSDEILAETDASGNTTAEYIFFGGKRIAMIPSGGNPSYYVEDLLGTSRVITQSNGAVCYDADFYPYGGERSYINACPQNYKFEGKERDTETGNDDFGARYYSNRFGRWLSADWSAVPSPIPYANLTNPQTLNLYAMVSDDPESFADLDGHLHSPSGDPVGPEVPFRECPTTEICNVPDQQQQAAQQAATADQAASQQQAQGQSGAQRWEAQQQVTPEKMANALVQAGKMGDAGVKAGLAVVGLEAAVAGAVVAAPTVAAAGGQAVTAINTATTSAYVQATTALSAAGTAISNAAGNAYRAVSNFTLQQAVKIDTMTSGGGVLGKAKDFVQAATSNRTPPAPNKFGAAGLVVKAAIKIFFP